MLSSSEAQFNFRLSMRHFVPEKWSHLWESPKFNKRSICPVLNTSTLSIMPWLHFWNSALDGGEALGYRFCRLILEERARGALCMGGWVGPWSRSRHYGRGSPLISATSSTATGLYIPKHSSFTIHDQSIMDEMLYPIRVTVYDHTIAEQTNEKYENI
jgi:hypothetical protein